MSDNVDLGLVLERLQRIQADVSDIKRDIRELKTRQTIVEGHLAGVMASLQLVNERIDRLGDDVRLIKRRFDLVEAE